MRLPVALVLAVFANCVVAAGDPPPPIDVGPEWEKVSYKALERKTGMDETWHYHRKAGGVLYVTKQECSPCEPIKKGLIKFTHQQRENDTALLAQHGNTTAVFEMSTEALHHLSTSYGFNSESYSYGLQLTTTDSITARDSMKLQQELMRMVEGWEPE